MKTRNEVLMSAANDYSTMVEAAYAFKENGDDYSFQLLLDSILASYRNRIESVDVVGNNEDGINIPSFMMRKAG